MKKKLLLVIICIMILPLQVYAGDADSTVSIGGRNTPSGTCAYNWCYAGISGIRVSLYKYDSNGLHYYKSIDYSINDDGNNIKTYYNSFDVDMMITGSKAGKVAYINNSSLDSSFSVKSNVNKLQNIVSSELSNTQCYYFCNKNSYNYSNSGISDAILKKYGLDTKNSTDIIKGFKDSFNIDFTVADLNSLYITVEPVALIYYSTKYSDGTLKSKKYYYGTAYELAKLRKSNGEMRGLETVLGGNFYASIYTPTGTAVSDSRTFIPDYIESFDKDLLPSLIWDNKNKTVYGTNADIDKNLDRTIGKDGLGIGVIWIGAKIQTCESQCGEHSKNSPNKLVCAEQFCEKHTNSSNEKKTCITSCGYDEPKPFTCSSTTCPNSTDLTCSNERTHNDIDYCKTFNNGYYMATCKENNTVTYNSSLPTTFGYGMGGLNYTIGLTGNLNCTLKFNTDLYTFEYAALQKTDRTNSAPVKALAAYNKIKNSKQSVSEINYSNALDTHSITIDGKVYDTKLVKGETNTPTISDGRTTYYYYEVSNNSSTKKGATTISYVTTGNAVYELPRYCLSMKSGDIISRCSAELKGHEDYYGYYNLIKENKEVDVVAKVEKKSGCIDETNTCYYLVDGNTESANCEVIDDYIYITNINVKNLMFNVGRGWKPMDLYPLKVTGPGTAKIKWVTASGETIIRSCSISTPSKTCKQTFKPTEYDKIRQYCNTHYLDDGYSSTSECYVDCSGTNSCKGNVTCSDKRSVESWCRTHTSDYKSIAQCVNDCSCSGGSEYIYRPIAAGNAFPNREAGSNWKGFEEIANKDTLKNANPIYVIVLDKAAINKIKADSQSKYIYKDFSNYTKVNVDSDHKGLNMTSKFIDNNKRIFKCIKGRNPESNSDCNRLQGGGI